MTSNSALVRNLRWQEGAQLFCEIVEPFCLTQEAAQCAAAFSIRFE